MNSTQISILRLLDAIKDSQDFQNIILQARLTENDFSDLVQDYSEVETISDKVDYLLNNFEKLDNAAIEGLHLACYESLDANKRHEIAKKYIESLWSKSAKDRPLMRDLHEMLETELDTQEPLRNRIYNLTDTLDSIKSELQDETPDYTKIIKWIDADLESESKHE